MSRLLEIFEFEMELAKDSVQQIVGFEEIARLDRFNRGESRLKSVNAPLALS